MQKTFCYDEALYCKELYKKLVSLREAFHAYGKISDSNAKLEELLKIILLQYSIKKKYIKYDAKRLYPEDKKMNLPYLQNLFEQIAENIADYNTEMKCLFGEKPSLVYSNGEEPLAEKMVELSEYIVNMLDVDTNAVNIDSINEVFSHFVRDSFRENIEDAQYMTPMEVTQLMSEIAITDYIEKGSLDKHSDNIIVMDPSCGVGSFLVAAHHFIKGKESLFGDKEILLIGQDKVERMVSIAFINMFINTGHYNKIHIGNSLADESPIAKYDGKVDIIITNPPFGAKIEGEYVEKKCRKTLDIYSNKGAYQYDSELLFIDRYITLLKPGGICLAIVPDSVISSKNGARYLRKELVKRAEIRSIIELPSVTFAQAGTRTKTSILYFVKKKEIAKVSKEIFMGEINDVGYQVKRRKGVMVKKYCGENELDKIKQLYFKNKEQIGHETIGEWVTIEIDAKDEWTPRKYIHQKKYNGLRLRDILNVTEKRRTEKYQEGCYFISVLHIYGEGLIDINAVVNYKPITPGCQVFPGEVIFSKINPRIPRAIVVPDMGRKILCSSEFEILTPRSDYSPYLLLFLLLDARTQSQICSMTSGTSASHSRIKTDSLLNINIIGEINEELIEKSREYEKNIKRIYEGQMGICSLRGIF